MEEESKNSWNSDTRELCHYTTKSVFVMHKHLERLERFVSDPHLFQCKSSTPEIYECELCEFGSDFKVTFSEHVRVYHEEKEVNGVLQRILECYKCKNCCFKTYSLLVLFRHVCQDLNREPPSMNVKLSEERHANPEFECAKCPFKTKLKSIMKTHTLLEHSYSEEINWFDCDECSFKTKQKSHLTRHIFLKHSRPEEIKWYECQKCLFKAKTKRHLRLHDGNRHKSAEEVNWYQCERCPFKAKQKSNLKCHVLDKHANLEEINWYKCEQCSYKSKRKGNLKGHISRQHPQKR